jgi:hypothetical protein
MAAFDIPFLFIKAFLFQIQTKRTESRCASQKSSEAVTNHVCQAFFPPSKLTGVPRMSSSESKNSDPSNMIFTFPRGSRLKCFNLSLLFLKPSEVHHTATREERILEKLKGGTGIMMCRSDSFERWAVCLHGVCAFLKLGPRLACPRPRTPTLVANAAITPPPSSILLQGTYFES